jgi:hypothetical protein
MGCVLEGVWALEESRPDSNMGRDGESTTRR